jgi:hypothetical protein
MPVMDEQVRKERAEKLQQLRSEGVRPADAWHQVAPESKAANSRAAELTRREIRRYRERYGATAAPEEQPAPGGGEVGGLNGASPNGTAAEVTTEDAAAKPAGPSKLCAGVEGKPPCGKEITGRSPRCDDCRTEHERLRKQRNNRNDYRRHGVDRKERAVLRELAEEERQRQEAERKAEEERQRQEAERKAEEERQRREEDVQRRVQALITVMSKNDSE